MMIRSPSGGTWEHSATLHINTASLVTQQSADGSWDQLALSADAEWAAKRGASSWFKQGTCASEPRGSCAMCFNEGRDLKAGVCWHDSTGANYSVPLYKLCAECPSGCGPFRNTPHVDDNVVRHLWHHPYSDHFHPLFQLRARFPLQPAPIPCAPRIMHVALFCNHVNWMLKSACNATSLPDARLLLLLLLLFLFSSDP